MMHAHMRHHIIGHLLGQAFIHEPDEGGIGQFGVLEQGIDTSTAEGRAMFGMLSVLAEFQRELIVANTRDGLAAARARGRKGGRKPRLSPEQAAHAQQLYDAGTHTVAQIAALLGVARPTVYGYLDRGPGTAGAAAAETEAR